MPSENPEGKTTEGSGTVNPYAQVENLGKLLKNQLPLNMLRLKQRVIAHNLPAIHSILKKNK